MTVVPRHIPAYAAVLGALLASIALALVLSADADAARKPAKLKLSWTRCSSTPFPCQGSHSVVVRTGRVLIGAGGMSGRAKVEFPVRTKAGRVAKRRVGGTFRTRTRLLVRVPGDAISGRIRVVMPGPRYSNSLRITVRKVPPKPKPKPPTTPPSRGGGTPVGNSVFDGSGMWIWYLRRSEGGDPARIAARAQAAGVRTVFVKSADGANVWSQFSSSAVAALKATGLNVCGWQFVYGNDPIGEARAAAAAKDAGADCFVIDAEGAYEGKYAQAQRYVRTLRAAVGDAYPIGLTSFPYVHFHPGFPYSVFMGPGGATFNLPQVYWKTIGTSVDNSLQITYQYNTVYEIPVYPLGQAYDGTSAADLRRFRQLSEGYGARGVSWWVWDYASVSDWGAIGADLTPIAAPASAGYPTLRVRSRGDLVVWAQQHLSGAGQSLTVDGDYGSGTASAVRAYQASKGLPETGVIDGDTWPTLLQEQPATPDWAAQAARASRAATGARASASAATRLPAVNGPRSAGLRALRNEIPAGPQR